MFNQSLQELLKKSKPKKTAVSSSQALLNQLRAGCIREKVREAKELNRQKAALSKSKSSVALSSSKKRGQKDALKKSVKKHKHIKTRMINLREDFETVKQINRLIHDGLKGAYSPCVSKTTFNKQYIKDLKRSKVNRDAFLDHTSELQSIQSSAQNLKKTKSVSKIECSHPNFRMWNELDIVERTKRWKQRRDHTIESKRKEQKKNEIMNCTFTPLLRKSKDMNSVKEIDKLVPKLQAGKIEKLTKMSIR